MGLIIASIKNQQSLGATASTFTEDIRFGYNVTSFHLDTFCLKEAATAATIQNMIDKITDVKLNTQSGTPESVIDGDDLFDANALIWKELRYHSILTSTDNIPHAFGMQLPMSAQPDDPTKNFGMPAGQGVQFVTDTAADVTADFDNFTTDLTVEGVDTKDKPSSLGYLRYQRDSFTAGAVGEVRETKIGTAKRLCGVLNFETTSFDELAASAAVDLVGIRQQEVTNGDQPIFNYKSFRSWSMKNIQTVATFAAAAAVINILDDGRFWTDYGILNDSGRVGLRIQGNPNISIKTTSGVAEATKVMPIALV